ncbi:hypothetical protein Agub_g8297 [Astrephomene gubernaculifera]|uniref:Uncharacterized protein n=1 Tax=Astrephomene gubernaculifera TaxID=47775 RepID=A0AAD3DRE8_9CHLO|nr:hypothetical protein Agub_g8297 [Astrephomene gubernaculifera]
MDLLGAYSDSDAEDQGDVREESRPGPSTSQPLVAPAQLRNAAPDPEPDKPAALFNPFASDMDTERPASHSTASPSGSGGSGPKRGFTQVTGSGPLQAAPPKASRTASSPTGPKPAFKGAMLVPPQLRNGRANVATEDVEKIFSKGNLAKRPAKEQTRE